MNPAATPEPVEDVQGDGRWMSMHKRFIAEAKEREPEVLFIGDSLFQQLGLIELWDKLFVPMHCLNFSIGGDQTQHLLWRLMNGELDNLSPKIVVLCIGTNNHEHTAEQVIGGIEEIVKFVEEKQPQATILVVSIPPRGQYPNPLRDKIAAINAGIATFITKHANAQFVNIDPSLFISPTDSSISHLDMHDYLHFTRKGYQKWTEPILEDIQNLLKNFLTADQASLAMVPSSQDIASMADVN